MKKIIITVVLGMFFAISHAQSLTDPIKEINKLLQPDNKIQKSIEIENYSSLASHLVLDKTNAIVRVQVQSKIGKEKVAVGSGSVIRDDGLIVTNYHVISAHFIEPTSTQIVFSIGKDIQEKYATLEAVDLVNDLALIKPLTPEEFKSTVAIEKRSLVQGQKIYSLGFPHNWSMTMIEGLFNGYMNKQVVSHYLVSNALSPGMSGGPSFNEDGNMVAINVAATNKLSILIPVASLNLFLTNYTNEQKSYPSYELKKFSLIRNNAIQRYFEFTDKILDTFIHSDNLDIGQFKLPLKNKLFECWSKIEKGDINLDKIETKTQESLSQTERICSTQDNIFLKPDNIIGQIGVNSHYYRNYNSSSFAMWKTIEKKFNVVAIKNENATKNDNGQCFIENVTNKNQKLKKMQICISPFKETNRLWTIQISQIYQNDFNEAMILDFIFNGFNEESIHKIIGFIKKI